MPLVLTMCLLLEMPVVGPCILASLTLRILDSKGEIFLNAVPVLEHPVDG